MKDEKAALTGPEWEQMRQPVNSHADATPDGRGWLAEALQRVEDDVVGATIVDLGSGSGALTLALAGTAGSVLATDSDSAGLDELARVAASAGHTNIRVIVSELEDFDLAPGSVDIVVSGYALHRLPDAEKRDLVRRCHRWLTPGGRFVVADMMFGRRQSLTDRRLATATARRVLPQGPGAWWQLMKDLLLFWLRLGLKQPAPPSFWVRALRDAGFRQVTQIDASGSAGVVTGIKDIRAGT